jgi:type I restriction enzyme, S subunit
MGDLLITKDGMLGIVRLIETDEIFSIFVSLALVKPVICGFGRYLALALSAPQIQERIVKTGTGPPMATSKCATCGQVKMLHLGRQLEII